MSSPPNVIFPFFTSNIRISSFATVVLPLPELKMLLLQLSILLLHYFFSNLPTRAVVVPASILKDTFLEKKGCGLIPGTVYVRLTSAQACNGCSGSHRRRIQRPEACQSSCKVCSQASLAHPSGEEDHKGIKARSHLLVHQVKHVFHVDKALLDDAVECANVVERGHELHEVGAQQDKVAHGEHSLLRDQI